MSVSPVNPVAKIVAPVAEEDALPSLFDGCVNPLVGDEPCHLLDLRGWIEVVKLQQLLCPTIHTPATPLLDQEVKEHPVTIAPVLRVSCLADITPAAPDVSTVTVTDHQTSNP